MRTNYFFFIYCLMAILIQLPQPAHALFEADDANKKAITNCGSRGDVCSDGTIFIGLYCPDEHKNLKSCVLLFAPPYDQGRLVTWSSDTKTKAIKNISRGDGDSNQGQVKKIANFQAFQKCSDLKYAGYDDWYLPAVDELNEMFKARRALSNFSMQAYWSSTEEDKSQVWTQSFANGSAKRQSKSQRLYSRCIRRQKFQ